MFRPTKPLPPVRAVNDLNHTPDHNLIRNALEELQSAIPSAASEVGATTTAYVDAQVASSLLKAPVTKTTAYTLALTDGGKVVEVNSASAVAVTVPTNASIALPVGTVIDVMQAGAGQVTVTPASTSVSVVGPRTLLTRAQFSVVTLRKRSTNGWVLTGDSAADTTTVIPDTAQVAPSSVFTTTGTWETGSTGEIYSRDSTGTATLTFTGTYVELFAITDTYHTSLGVQIDSGIVTAISEQSNVRNTSASIFRTSGLSSGTHTLKVTVLADDAPVVTVLQARVAAFTAPAGNDPTPPATTTPVTGFVTRNTSSVGLTLNGQAYKFVGFNAVCMLGPTNATRQITDDAAYYRDVAYGMTDRVWALPGCDMARLDRIVQAAKANGARLLITLFDALGSGGPNWSTLKGNFGSYSGHLSTIVTRYKSEPTIFGWEIANEPPQDRAGFDLIGKAIKDIDPVHLVSTGTSAIYNDGDVTGFQNAGASAYVDLLSMHEYDSLQTQSSHLNRILAPAATLKKPIILGEVGIDANAGGTGTGSTANNGVTTFTGRATLIRQKTDAYLGHAEVCGFNYWSVGQNSIGSQADSYMYLGESAGINAMKTSSAKWSKNAN